MKKLRISKIWIAVVVIVIVAVAAWAMSGGKKEEDINFKEEKVALKTLQNSVTATGTIEAVTSVTVGTQVSGIVNKLYVDYNSQVKKGQVIAELDKTNLLSELNTAKANLASAQSMHILPYDQSELVAISIPACRFYFYVLAHHVVAEIFDLLQVIYQCFVCWRCV